MDEWRGQTALSVPATSAFIHGLHVPEYEITMREDSELLTVAADRCDTQAGSAMAWSNPRVVMIN